MFNCDTFFTNRDRAEERRRGINPDYAAANQFSGVVGSKDVDATKLSVEYSKFLGGDLEHTHLVKGLDYSLLQQASSVMQPCMALYARGCTIYI